MVTRLILLAVLGVAIYLPIVATGPQPAQSFVPALATPTATPVMAPPVRG